VSSGSGGGGGGERGDTAGSWLESVGLVLSYEEGRCVLSLVICSPLLPPLSPYGAIERHPGLLIPVHHLEHMQIAMQGSRLCIVTLAS